MEPTFATRPDEAWAEYVPSPRRPWTRAMAAHLLGRAAFGPRPEELDRAVAEGPRRTIDRLLRPGDDARAFSEEHDEYEDAVSPTASPAALRPWWLRRMMLGPDPLRERMTLFWHDHFATSARQVTRAGPMRAHVRALRRHALGSFDELLVEMSEDPALMLGLGATAQRKARPALRLARELLDRFTLGPDVATDEDVLATARAFTGRFVLRDRYRWIPREHDGGMKRLLGREGPFTARDALAILADQETTSRWIILRLWRWLVTDRSRPSDEWLEPLASAWRRDRHMGRLVERILRSDIFFSFATGRDPSMVRSPVDYALSIVRPLGGNVSTTRLAADLARLGQDLYAPPTVRGWIGGPVWIRPALIAGRHNLAAALLAPEGVYGGRLDPAGTAERLGHRDARAAAEFLLETLLPHGIDPTVRDALEETAPVQGGEIDPSRAEELRLRALAIVTLPEFQVA